MMFNVWYNNYNLYLLKQWNNAWLMTMGEHLFFKNAYLMKDILYR